MIITVYLDCDNRTPSGVRAEWRVLLPVADIAVTAVSCLSGGAGLAARMRSRRSRAGQGGPARGPGRRRGPWCCWRWWSDAKPRGRCHWG